MEFNFENTGFFVYYVDEFSSWQGGFQMTQETVVNIAQNALMTVLYVSAPLLGISLIVGLAVSVFQATTQIQEQTLSFIPKILSVIVAIAVLGSWMLNVLTEYTSNLYDSILQFIR